VVKLGLLAALIFLAALSVLSPFEAFAGLDEDVGFDELFHNSNSI
jgi:hypothetical protein